MGKDLYRDAMNNIYQKVALQEIRKVIRGHESESEKLVKIVTIVHSFEEDIEESERIAERRAIEEDEEKLRKERINDMFEGMVEPLNRLTVHKGDGK